MALSKRHQQGYYVQSGSSVSRGPLSIIGLHKSGGKAKVRRREVARARQRVSINRQLAMTHATKREKIAPLTKAIVNKARLQGAAKR